MKRLLLLLFGPALLAASYCQAQPLTSEASPRAELVLIDKMNHVLKDCESTAPQQQMATYNNPTLPLNTVLRDAIIRFIKRNQ